MEEEFPNIENNFVLSISGGSQDNAESCQVGRRHRSTAVISLHHSFDVRRDSARLLAPHGVAESWLLDHTTSQISHGVIARLRSVASGQDCKTLDLILTFGLMRTMLDQVGVPPKWYLGTTMVCNPYTAGTTLGRESHWQHQLEIRGMGRLRHPCYARSCLGSLSTAHIQTGYKTHPTPA